MSDGVRACLLVSAISTATGCVHATSATAIPPPISHATRLSLLRQAQLWIPTDVSSMDVRRGPAGAGSFAEGETLSCDYVPKKMTGRSPKFTCRLGSADEIKVKYGRGNGEVYGEVAATRLLWALGFGADWMYPVQVMCRGCPAALGGRPLGSVGERYFEVAAVERKMPGHELRSIDGDGWAWSELDLIDESVGGAPKSQVDALKLLAALLQHTDSKPEQQRLICLEPITHRTEEVCRVPFLMVSDLGLTFGRANRFNSDAIGSVNFEGWSKTAVWRDRNACVANIQKSATGTLENPVITEAGREFLASLLTQLTDRQLRDLFEVARFDLRLRAPDQERSKPAAIDAWVDAFKRKRDEVSQAHCAH